MDERDEPVRHETTVINAGGDRGGGLLIGVILVLLIGVAAFLYFGGYIGHGAGDRDININIKAPDINITPPSAPAPSPPAGNSAK